MSSRILDDEALAPLALERARLLAPLLTGGVLWYAIADELVGFPLSTTSFVIDLVIAGLLGTLTVLLWRRKIADRYGHVVLGAIWWSAVAASLQSFIIDGQHTLALLFILEMLGLSLVLHLRTAAVSIIVFDLIFVPLIIESDLRDWREYLAGTLWAQVLGLVFHHIFRQALVDAEHRRRAQHEDAAELARQLDALVQSRAEREGLADQLAATQRMEATGTLAASFAHQMNNILTGITMSASLLARRAPPPQRADYDVILSESQRGSDLTRALLAFSRRGAAEREARCFDDAVRGGMELISRTLPRTLTLELALDAAVAVSCDPVQIGQLVVNLVLNASDAMSASGTVTVTTDVVVDGDTRHARLRVRDHGRGMDDATRARAFDPFFTTKQLGKGTGLGLSTAWGIVRSHDGTIELESTIDVGTTVTVQFPLAKEPVA